MSETKTGTPHESVLDEARKARAEVQGAQRDYEVEVREASEQVQTRYDQSGELHSELLRVDKDLEETRKTIAEIGVRGGEVPQRLTDSLKRLETAAASLKSDIARLNTENDQTATKRPEVAEVSEEAKREHRKYGSEKIMKILEEIKKYREDIYRRDRLQQFFEMPDDELDGKMDKWVADHKEGGWNDPRGLFENFGVFLNIDRNVRVISEVKQAIQKKLKEYPNNEVMREKLKALLKDAEKEIEKNDELSREDIYDDGFTEKWAREFVGKK